MGDDLLFQIALTRVPFVGYVHAKLLAQHFGSAEGIFSAKRSQLESIEGIGEVRAKSIKQFSGFREAEKELCFIEKFRIETLFITSAKYPQRLLNCYDPPTLLFYKGNTDLNASRMVAIVGTRNNTASGKQITETIISHLLPYDVVIVSGLAHGIDSITHHACLRNGSATIGVLAHGLDTIYPPENAGLAKTIITAGGLLTEFGSNTKPDKHNFPSRNRIVAGLCDATIVVETGVKGGSMITGELAYNYNRDLFAIPGRITDLKSAGCNFLIRTHKAMLMTNVSELAESLGWNDATRQQRPKQKKLFVDLNTDEQIVYQLIAESESLDIDALNFASGLSSSKLCATLLSLEFKNLIVSLPGKHYQAIR